MLSKLIVSTLPPPSEPLEGSRALIMGHSGSPQGSTGLVKSLQQNIGTKIANKRTGGMH